MVVLVAIQVILAALEILLLHLRAKEVMADVDIHIPVVLRVVVAQAQLGLMA